MNARAMVLMVTLALCAAMSGCTRLDEAAMPVAEKVNSAYPVAADVKVARERLLLLLSDDDKGLGSIHAAASNRMAMRALTCSKNVAIGRFDSVASVKRWELDPICFQEQDRELLKYYGIRTVGALLLQPPLRPFKPAGAIAALPRGKLDHIYGGAVARDAGVGLLVDVKSTGVVAEIPGGAPIAQLPRIDSLPDPSTSLSPNGRVLVVHPSGQGPVFIEAQTGQTIWSIGSGGGSRMVAWLPEMASFVVNAIDEKVVLADGLLGTMQPYPVDRRNASFGSSIPGPSSRLLMGTDRELVLMEHARAPNGITASEVRRYKIDNAARVTSGKPVSMLSGRLVVYASNRDIGWLNLESGSSGAWRTSPFFGIPFAKLDENRIMFDAIEPGEMTLRPWALDVAKETVAPIDFDGPRGLIVDIGERVGFFRRGDDAWFGDVVKTSDAKPLPSVLADADHRLQLRKLQAMTASLNPALEPPLNEAATLAQGAHGAHGALLRRGIATSVTAAPVVPVDPVPGLGNVPKNAEIHMIGVYEGKGEARPGMAQSIRNVRVTVRGSGRPIVLVLASYDPVNWVVTNAGAKISAVLLSGYHPSEVKGTEGAPVLRIGSAYAYSANTAEYAQLRQAVAQYTHPLEIKSFQGTYSGTNFSVGGH